MLIGNIEIPRAKVMAEPDWLAERSNFIGSSDAAALFGLGYSFMPSVWSLWAEKSGRVPHENSGDDERMAWGQLLERPILELVKRRTGWDVLFPIDKVDPGHFIETLSVGARRLRIEAPREDHKVNRFLAATCDAFVLSHEDGLGLIEVKNRDFLAWRDEYTEDDAAARDQIQLAHQFICVPEASWGVIAVLVGGNDLKLYHYRREDMARQMADIQARAVTLMDQLADDIEPDIIDERELPSWARVHFDDPIIEQVDVQGQDWERFGEACRIIFVEDPMAKDMAKRVKAAKATITGIVGKCEIARSPGWTLKIKTSQRAGASISLPEAIKDFLFDQAGKSDPVSSLDLMAAANWSIETRRAGLSRSFEVDKILGDAHGEADIVEDIRATELGG